MQKGLDERDVLKQKEQVIQLPIAFDFDLCYHANAELLDCPEL